MTNQNRQQGNDQKGQRGGSNDQNAESGRQAKRATTKTKTIKIPIPDRVRAQVRGNNSDSL